MKKIRASTLMETMVATVLIVIIFIIASLLLNSVFANGIKGNHQELTSHLQQLQYQYQEGRLTIPHFEEWGEWDIEVQPETVGPSTFLSVAATHKKTKKQLRTYGAFLQ